MNAFAAILLAALVGGGVAVLSKIALTEIPPLTFVFVRFISALLILFPLFLKERPRLTKAVIPVVIISLFAVANVVLFAIGVRLTAATISQMLYAAVPIIAALLSAIILKEKLTPRKIGGVLLGFAGVMVIVLLPALERSASFAGSLPGNLIILTAVLSFSLYTVLSKRYQKSFSSIYMITVFTVLTVCIQFFATLTELAAYPGWWETVSLPALGSLLYVGIFGTAIYYVMYQYAIKKGNPVLASMTLYLQPVATYLWAFFLLGERLTIGFISGAVLSFVGAWLVTRSK